MVKRLYDPLVRDARDRFAGRPAVASLLSPDTNPAALERCLLAFCAYGIAMTDCVESWIRRAADRCVELGLEDVGHALHAHAAHEAGHHLMLIADTRKLVERWNCRHQPELDVDKVLALELPTGVLQYRELHERTIEGETPYCQLAIEYEIEQLSVRFGPVFLKNCRRLLGDEILSGLTFVEKRIELDASHTVFHRHRLEALLACNPRYARSLAQAGSDALAAYAAFLENCWDA
ncbi:MAG TPA: hypothetical protein VKF40_12715 [Burkholderiales bacterium]|nr:hypothetical protein [Burkholderiales bacterium]